MMTDIYYSWVKNREQNIQNLNTIWSRVFGEFEGLIKVSFPKKDRF